MCESVGHAVMMIMMMRTMMMMKMITMMDGAAPQSGLDSSKLQLAHGTMTRDMLCVDLLICSYRYSA